MDVNAAAAPGEPDLRGPEAEPGARADQIPTAILAALAVSRLLEAEQVAVKMPGGLEVGDLEDQLGYGGDCRGAQLPSAALAFALSA